MYTATASLEGSRAAGVSADLVPPDTTGLFMVYGKSARRLSGAVSRAAVEAMEQRVLLSIVTSAGANVVGSEGGSVAVTTIPTTKSNFKSTPTSAVVVTPTSTNPIATPADVVAGGPYATPAGTGTPAATTYSPSQISEFYGINNISFNSIVGNGAGQTIAIIDAYQNPQIVATTNPNFSTSNLHTFDAKFGLPDPPSFTIVPELGYALPATYDSSWALEIALDVEWTHALAPAANIVLVECQSAYADDLIGAGVPAAQAAGATVVTMSFTIPETGTETYTTSGDPTFRNSTNITYVAATGDNGVAGTGYPAFSPYVIAAGGTTITTSDSQGDYSSEVVWNDTSIGKGATGGGISTIEPQPSYQDSETLSGSARGVPDVAFDGDPQTGVYVLDTSQSGGGGYYRVGGTSLSSPAWAALVAIADQGYTLSHGYNASAGLSMGGITSTLPRLYDLPASDFHDITSGNNTYTPYSSQTGYSAGTGYDLASGLGSPVANTLIPDLAGVATITGQVFSDNNNDGTDMPLAGKIVYLDLNNDGVLDNNEPTAVTNSSGGYLFTNQSAGGTVRLTSPNIAGYMSTTTSAAIAYGSTDTVNLTYFPISYSTTAPNTDYTLLTDSTGTIDQIAINGSVQYSIAKSLLSTLSFSLTGAGDSLTIDGTNGNPIPVNGIAFNGSNAGDLLTIDGTAAGNDAFNVSSSAISFGTTPITFSHVSTLMLNPGTGTDALNVASGSVTIAGRNTGNGILTGSRILVRNFSSLAVASGAVASFATASIHTNRMLVETTSLSVQGQLDLGGNDMIVHFGSLPAITSLLASGYANGNWTGDGIASLAAANDTTHLTALGAISNNVGNGNALYGSVGQPLFDGQAPLAADILIKYTYYGDTNLDGTVDGSDYTRIDNAALLNLTGWYNGDFNYDTLINGSDYSLIDNTYNTQGTAL
jgi:hypothetical protein